MQAFKENLVTKLIGVNHKIWLKAEVQVGFSLLMPLASIVCSPVPEHHVQTLTHIFKDLMFSSPDIQI